MPVLSLSICTVSRSFSTRIVDYKTWTVLSILIRSKVSILVYKVLHGCAPSYLGPFTYADLPSRRGLSSSCSDCLVQPPVYRSTVGSRAFSVAGRQVWNCLWSEVTSAPSLATFRTRLETYLFTESYPDSQWVNSSDIFVSWATLIIHDILIDWLIDKIKVERHTIWHTGPVLKVLQCSG